MSEKLHRPGAEDLTESFGRILLFRLSSAAVLALVVLLSVQAHAGEAEWQVYMRAGIAAMERGDYRSAEGQFVEARREAESFGHEDPRFGATLFQLARSYVAWGRLADAEPLYLRALMIMQKALGPEDPNVGRALNGLAKLYQSQGRFSEAESRYRGSLVIVEKALGREHGETAMVLNDLATLHLLQGRFSEAEPLLRRSLATYEKLLGPDHRHVATTLSNLGLLYVRQGRFAEAEYPYRRALRIAEETLGLEHPDVALSLSNLAELHFKQGQFAEAEPLFRRALEITEKALGSDHTRVAVSLNNLANLYSSQGRLADAEVLFRRSLAIFERGLGSHHPEVGSVLTNLALVYQRQGRPAEAEPLSTRALRVYEKALGQDHPDVGLALNNIAFVYQAQGRFAEAEPVLRRSLSIHEKSLGPDHPQVGLTLNNLALNHQRQNQYTEAEFVLRRAIGIFERTFVTDHPDLWLSQNNLAILLQAQGNPNEALAIIRRANSGLERRLTANTNLSRRGALTEQRTRSRYLEFHVSLLATFVRHESGVSEVSREGFAIAQLARASDTAEQVAKMATRHAAGSDVLAKLVRTRQDLLARFEQLDSRIVDAAGQRGAETSAMSLRAEQGSVLKAIAELDDRLERDFPQYREMTNPTPLDLLAAQRLLAEDEALVLLLVSSEESFLWALRRNDSGFFKLPLRSSDLKDLVKKVRRQLDLGVEDPERILARPFDVVTAHDLYQRILAPAKALLATAKQLIFVPDAAMQSLPPGVLVTELPAKPIGSLADHAHVAWLAKTHAITVLPAVGSLRALRQFAKAPASREPFSGFGDPVLEGTTETARRVNVATLYSRGAVADASEVRKLARLPESADELRAIAATLKAPVSAIKVGSAATERAVKEADLTRYRNLAFATHGLMAGEFKGLAEPALVLTPPEKGSELDDGLLTASEISKLKLDADWVVLSACNTAAPDGTPGAEGLSGLARAFFYAGARSLLVSHWAVSSDATVALTTHMFGEFVKGVSKAEALRRSMLGMMASADKPHFAHPAFWAPFVIVGEGR